MHHLSEDNIVLASERWTLSMQRSALVCGLYLDTVHAVPVIIDLLKDCMLPLSYTL